jgi:PPIC-type PPIASE domain
MERPCVRLTVLVLFVSVGLLTKLVAQQTGAPSDQKTLPTSAQTQASQPPSAAPPPASSGEAEPPKPIAPDKVVLRVGDEKVTAGDFYSMMSVSPNDALRVGSKTRRNMGDQYALMLILADKAMREGLDSTPDFTRQLAMHRIQLLAQMKYKSISDGIKITPEELNQYYSSHKEDYEEVELRRVYIPHKAQGANADAPGLSREEAQAHAQAISKELIAGKDMKELEKELADKKIAFFDKNTERALIKQLPPEFKKVLVQLKPGQISEPIESAQGFSVVQLVGHDYVDPKIVSIQLEEQMRKEKMGSVVDELKHKATIWMDDEYFNYDPPFVPTASAPNATAPPKPGATTTLPPK